MDFAKICRLCCEEKQPLQSILKDDANCSLKELFSNILQIEVYTDDLLPQNACEQCVNTLVKLNQTIEVFRENDLRLRRQLFGDFTVKEELQEMQIELLVEPIMAKPELEPERDSKREDSSEESMEYGLKQDSNDDPDFDEHEDIDMLEDDDYNPSPDEDEEVERIVHTKRKRPTKQTVRKPRGEPRRPRQKGKVGRPRTVARQEHMPRINDNICYVCKSEPHESADALFKHLHIAHADVLPYTCPICVHGTVVIDSVTTLNEHKKMHERPFKCPHCDRHYICKRGVEDHIKRAHEGAELPCPSKCPQCDKVCPTRQSLEFHMYRHKQEIACDICGKVSASKTKLRVHIARKHTPNAQKVECHICHKMLQSRDSVQNHIKYMHATTEPLQCPYCPRTYASKHSLQSHINKHESNPEKGPSNDWKKYYTFVEGDEGIKNGIRLKKCNICNAIVRQISMHMIKLHFPQEYPCTLCEAVFKDKKPLQVHMLEHTHGKFLKCPICDREFIQRDYLIKHLRTKKHRDHPLAQSLDWLEAKYPNTVYGKKKEEASGSAEAVSTIIGAV